MDFYGPAMLGLALSFRNSCPNTRLVQLFAVLGFCLFAFQLIPVIPCVSCAVHCGTPVASLSSTEPPWIAQIHNKIFKMFFIFCVLNWKKLFAIVFVLVLARFAAVCCAAIPNTSWKLFSSPPGTVWPFYAPHPHGSPFSSPAPAQQKPKLHLLTMKKKFPE